MREASSANATCDCWVESGGGTERRVAATGPNMSETSSMNPSRSSSGGDHARILERPFEVIDAVGSGWSERSHVDHAGERR